ncbi:MAG: DMT family transporter [Pseudomonadota bacterium]
MAPPSVDRPLRGVAYMLVGVASMSAMDALIKWAVAALPIMEIVALRAAFAMALLAPVMGWAGGRAALATRRPLAHGLRALVSLAAILCFFEALRRLPLATAIAIGFAAPLFMTALSVPLLGERVGIHRWTAVAAGFVGVLVIARPGTGVFSLAAMLAIAASLFFAVSMIAVRWLARTETDAAMVFYQNLGILVGSAAYLPVVWVPVAALEVAVMATMAVALVLGQVFTVKALRVAAVGLVAPFQYTELIWAALLGFAFWGEVPEANVWVGAAVVVLSGLYTIWRESEREERRHSPDIVP